MIASSLLHKVCLEKTEFLLENGVIRESDLESELPQELLKWLTENASQLAEDLTSNLVLSQGSKEESLGDTNANKEEITRIGKRLDYWQNKLDGLSETLDMPTDFPRPAGRLMTSETYSFLIESELAQQLKSLAEMNECSLYMVCLAVLKILLKRYTGQEDVCVGAIVANHSCGEAQSLTKAFFNRLALRSSVQSNDAFVDVLKKVQETCFEAYENRDTPFRQVADLIQPHRNKTVHPLYQIMMVLHNASVEMGENIQQYPLESEVSNLDVTLELREEAKGLRGQIEYNSELYRSNTIDRMASHFIA
ncbi:MAG: condensation domain-containing protein, partial [Kangiellaceae bacterium]|nr:condensation domain-containing protein [Kangiellaceae bacterium]